LRAHHACLLFEALPLRLPSFALGGFKRVFSPFLSVVPVFGMVR
jgi:hypothetical protein